MKIKTDSLGSVHYEAWSQPHGERTVLTKPKILCVPIVWLREEVSKLVGKMSNKMSSKMSSKQVSIMSYCSRTLHLTYLLACLLTSLPTH